MTAEQSLSSLLECWSRLRFTDATSQTIDAHSKVLRALPAALLGKALVVDMLSGLN